MAGGAAGAVGAAGRADGLFGWICRARMGLGGAEDEVAARTCGGTALAPGASGCPSRLQNFAPGRFRKPHLGQTTPAVGGGATGVCTRMVALGEIAGIWIVAGAPWFGRQCCKAERMASAL